MSTFQEQQQHLQQLHRALHLPHPPPPTHLRRPYAAVVDWKNVGKKGVTVRVGKRTAGGNAASKEKQRLDDLATLQALDGRLAKLEQAVQARLIRAAANLPSIPSAVSAAFFHYPSHLPGGPLYPSATTPVTDGARSLSLSPSSSSSSSSSPFESSLPSTAPSTPPSTGPRHGLFDALLLDAPSPLEAVSACCDPFLLESPTDLGGLAVRSEETKEEEEQGMDWRLAEILCGLKSAQENAAMSLFPTCSFARPSISPSSSSTSTSSTLYSHPFFSSSSCLSSSSSSDDSFPSSPSRGS